MYFLRSLEFLHFPFLKRFKIYIMAMKANASNNGGKFKQFIGVGSFRVVGVNPTKEEYNQFYGREMSKNTDYLVDKKDDQGNAYKTLRVTYLVQADPKDELGKTISTNKVLPAPIKSEITFFLDSRYNYNNDKTKVQVIDKYGRTAWVTIEQARNHQIPIYSNGPAKIDSSYRPAYRGEENLLTFITNYLNVSRIEEYNKNTGMWERNPNPDDCEAGLYEINNYFKGDIKELKEHLTMMPTNRLKLLVGLESNDDGKLFYRIYNGATLKNGTRSYTYLQDVLSKDSRSSNILYSDDHAGIITDLHEYNEDVQETNFANSSADSNDPFLSAPALQDSSNELPFPEPALDNPFNS
jgi:hypothetical protein